jgi:hypothetical protein
MKNKISKRKVLDAINKLIDGYQNKTLKHTIDCPLCKLFHNYFCEKNCPNYSFNGGNYLHCINRCRIYPYLNWDNSEHKLIEYWKEILELYKKESLKDINELNSVLQEKILKIAEKYK